jgi:hypothetical protein
MKYWKRSLTNGQHAPTSGRCAVGRQASRSVPLHTAWVNMNSMNGGTIQ